MREHLPGSIIPDAVIDRLARAGDPKAPKAEGKRICIELLQELTQIPAVSGAHIMAPRNHSAIAEVIAEARSAGISSVPTQRSDARYRAADRCPDH
jgi:methylenetetrahydrofolate reductase (NADPH)